MTFDPTKPVKTRDGRKARIICTDANNHQPIVALITESNGHEYNRNYTKDGFYFIGIGKSDSDLINIPERRIRWTNVYAYHADGSYLTQELADENAAARRLGVLKLTYEDDQLVDHEYVKLK